VIYSIRSVSGKVIACSSSATDATKSGLSRTGLSSADLYLVEIARPYTNNLVRSGSHTRIEPDRTLFSLWITW